jgi:glycogen synthase
MNVLLFPSAYHPSLGGVEELSRQLAMELTRQGHGVAVMANRWPRDLPRVERLDGIDVHRLPLRTRGAGWKSEVSYRLTSSLVQRDVTRLVRAHRADVVHVICVWPGVSYALDACAALGVPVVTTLQGELTMDANKLYERSESARCVLRRALSESAQVTACSAKTLADAVAFSGGSIDVPSSVVFNGARVEDFAGTSDGERSRRSPFVLAIGRLVEQKGFDVLLRAIADDKECLPEGWELVIAGDGPLAGALAAQADSLGLAGRVTFPGRADRAEVIRLMRECEFVVVPSRADEGLPVVCAESAAARRAVVGTRRGGIPEIVIDGQTGVIVPPEDAASLGRAIRLLSSDSERRHRMGNAARERSAEFAWPHITRQYVDVYERAIARCAARRGRAEAVSA